MCLLFLAGCVTVADSEATRDSLTEVTKDPEPPSAAQEYDSNTSPDPIVEPSECSNDLIITVRGTGEPRDGQLLSPVARMISEARPDALVLDLDYPADTDVKEGGTKGVRMLIDTLNVQSKSCPGQDFILLGYSQGALVVGDALSDPADRMVGASVGELEPIASDRILAVVLYGDPRFVGGEAYNAGTYNPMTNGLLPRPADSLEQFAGRIRDFCSGNDFICQSSLDLNEEGHVSYFENGMQEQGAAFVIGLLDPPPTEE